MCKGCKYNSTSQKYITKNIYCNNCKRAYNEVDVSIYEDKYKPIQREDKINSIIDERFDKFFDKKFDKIFDKKFDKIFDKYFDIVFDKYFDTPIKTKEKKFGNFNFKDPKNILILGIIISYFLYFGCWIWFAFMF